MDDKNTVDGVSSESVSITENPQQATSTDNQVVQVGEPRRKWFFRRGRLGKKFILAALVFLAFVAVAVWWFILRDNVDSTENQQSANIIQQNNTETETIIPEDYEFTGPQFATNPNGDKIELKQNGKTVLTRTVYDWQNYLIQGDQLFFASQDPNDTKKIEFGETVEDQKYLIHSYNFKTGKYQKVGEVMSTSPAIFFSGIHHLDESMYGVFIGGYKSSGRTYACPVVFNGEICGETDLLFEGPGSVEKRGGNYFVVDLFGDAGISTFNVSSLDIKTKKTKTIVDGGSALDEGQLGTYYIGMDDSSCIWLYGATVTGLNSVNINETLVEIYCLDASGKKQSSIMAADIPLNKPSHVFSLKDNRVMTIYSKDKKVTYDVVSKKFGKVENYDSQNYGDDSETIVQELKSKAPSDLGLEFVLTKAEE